MSYIVFRNIRLLTVEIASSCHGKLFFYTYFSRAFFDLLANYLQVVGLLARRGV